MLCNPQSIVCVSLVVLASLGGRACAQFESREQRIARLEALSPTAKEQLARKQERFEKLKPEEQTSLRKLRDDIAADPRGQRLQQVMLRYNDWLKTLRSNERIELISLPASERVARIHELMEEQEKRRFKDLKFMRLETEDREALFKWLNTVVSRIEDKLITELNSRERTFYDRIPDKSPMRHAFLVGKRFEKRGRNAPFLDLIEAVDEDVATLQASLSATARAALEETRDEAEKRELVASWVRMAMMTRRRTPVPDEELQRFLAEEVEPAEREYFENLTPQRMREELTSRYIRARSPGRRFGERGPRRGGFRGPGPFREGPRGEGPRGEGRRGGPPPKREPTPATDE